MLSGDAGGWRVSTGGIWRQIGGVKFSHAAPQGPGFILPSLQGRVSDPGTGIYDDGFVLPDAGKGDSTTFFGYNHQSQTFSIPSLESSGLALHKTIQTVESNLSAAVFDSDWSHSMDGFGVFVSLESPAFLHVGPLGVGVQASYSWVGMSAAQANTAFSANSQLTTTRQAVTDVYTLGGEDFPDAPYHGPFNGKGPSISLTPDNHTVAVTRTTQMIHAESVFADKLSLNLHTFSFGPTMALSFKSMQIAMSTGLAINVADWQASSVETLTGNGGKTLATWSNRASGTKALAGAYVETKADIPVSANCAVRLAARYDWAGTMHGKVGAASFSANLNGASVMVGVTLKF